MSDTWGLLPHGAALPGTFLMLPEILPNEEALSKPLWQVFMEACGWFLEAPGWCLLLLGGFQVFAVTFW